MCFCSCLLDVCVVGKNNGGGGVSPAASPEPCTANRPPASQRAARARHQPAKEKKITSFCPSSSQNTGAFTNEIHAAFSILATKKRTPETSENTKERKKEITLYGR